MITRESIKCLKEKINFLGIPLTNVYLPLETHGTYPNITKYERLGRLIEVPFGDIFMSEKGLAVYTKTICQAVPIRIRSARIIPGEEKISIIVGNHVITITPTGIKMDKNLKSSTRKYLP